MVIYHKQPKIVVCGGGVLCPYSKIAHCVLKEQNNPIRSEIKDDHIFELIRDLQNNTYSIIHLQVYVHTDAYMYICVCACLCVCVCVSKATELCTFIETYVYARAELKKLKELIPIKKSSSP